MARTLFPRILLECLGNSQKLLTTNQYLGSTIFLTNINISFFNVRFNLISVCCSSPCFCVLLCTDYGSLQCFLTYFQKLIEIGFYGQYFQAMLFFVTLLIYEKFAEI